MNVFPRVYISILNWNGLSDTLKCLESVYSLDYPNFEVVVVDNDSRDNPAEVIGKLHPQTKLILNAANLGFAGGHNVGVAYAMKNSADYVWLVNNDAVAEPGSLRKMIEYAEADEAIGLVGPLIYDIDNPDEWLSAGDVIDWKNLSHLYSLGPHNAASLADKDIWLSGAALLIKRSVVESVGYLNEGFFAYCEDIEYSIRSVRHGFRNAVCTSAKIYHRAKQLDDGNAKPHVYYFLIRNRLLLGYEYLPGHRARVDLLREILAKTLGYLGVFRRYGKIENATAMLNGAWHGLRQITGPMTSENPMPPPLRKLFLTLARHHPYLLACIVKLNAQAIIRSFHQRHHSGNWRYDNTPSD